MATGKAGNLFQHKRKIASEVVTGYTQLTRQVHGIRRQLLLLLNLLSCPNKKALITLKYLLCTKVEITIYESQIS